MALSRRVADAILGHAAAMQPFSSAAEVANVPAPAPVVPLERDAA